MTGVFFISGAPKSGTTWFQRMLNSHPEIVCKGEGHFVESLIKPLGTVIRNYNKKLQLVEERVYQGKPYYHRYSQSEFDQLCRNIIDARILSDAKPGVKLYGDKTPRYYEFFDTLKRLYPSAKLLNVRSDPRDVVVSRMFQASRVGMIGALEKGGAQRRDLIEGGIKQCIQCNEHVRAAEKKYPGDVIEVAYEAMLEAPHDTLAAIMSFLGMEKDMDLFDQIIGDNSFSSMTSRSPGEMDEMSFLRKGIAGDWRNELTAQEADYIANLCAALKNYFA